jgi:hypothetical protein
MTIRDRLGLTAGLTLVLISITASAQKIECVSKAQMDSLKAPACVPAAPSGYDDHRCVYTIDRQSPISPPAFLVPPGTEVYVKIFNTRVE